MNRLYGTITKVEHSGTINRVIAECGGVPLACVTLDLAAHFKEGSRVAVVFKETEVALARGGDIQVSISNQLICTVASVEEGEILAEVTLAFEGMQFSSIITTASLKRLEIKEGARVTALIKANEVSLEEAES